MRVMCFSPDCGGDQWGQGLEALAYRGGRGFGDKCTSLLATMEETLFVVWGSAQVLGRVLKIKRLSYCGIYVYYGMDWRLPAWAGSTLR